MVLSSTKTEDAVPTKTVEALLHGDWATYTVCAVCNNELAGPDVVEPSHDDFCPFALALSLRERLAWLAGLADGDCSISITRVNRRPDHQTLLSQVTLYVTDRRTAIVVNELLRSLRVRPRWYDKKPDRPTQRDGRLMHVAKVDDVLRIASALQPFAVKRSEHWEIIRDFAMRRIAAREAAGGDRKEMGLTDDEWALADRLRDLNHAGRVPPWNASEPVGSPKDG